VPPGPLDHREVRFVTYSIVERIVMATGYVWHELYTWHDTNQGVAGTGKAGLGAQPFPHIESPESKSRLNSMIHVSGLIDHLVRLAPRSAAEEDLLRVHTSEYVASVRAKSAVGGGDGGDGITPFGAGSYEIARLAAGGTIAAVEAVLEGRADNAYALVRPPGHHALPGTGMGACLFANIAIAVEWARVHSGVRRVAVVDWDVHHGNGTQSIFEADPDTLAISLHQEQLFPFGSGLLEETGVGDGVGATINVPFPAGTGNGGYVEAVRDVVIPALQAFAPELIVVASGFDASALDPLGNQVVTSSGYRAMTRLLIDVADKVCGGRLVFSHEGGYSPIYVPFCGLAVLEELSGVRTGVDDYLEDLWVRGPASHATNEQRKVVAAAREIALQLRLSRPE
jgi:acetoin utilization deacetylase AcuC-like enzyme